MFLSLTSLFSRFLRKEILKNKEFFFMYDKKSDYALNKKNKEAIVFRNAAGGLIHLTKDEFASEEEFACDLFRYKSEKMKKRQLVKLS